LWINVLGWPQTSIPKSVSQVARVIDMGHQHLVHLTNYNLVHYFQTEVTQIITTFIAYNTDVFLFWSQKFSNMGEKQGGQQGYIPSGSLRVFFFCFFFFPDFCRQTIFLGCNPCLLLGRNGQRSPQVVFANQFIVSLLCDYNELLAWPKIISNLNIFSLIKHAKLVVI
jgi:hypothetical protein